MEKAINMHPEDFCDKCKQPNIIWFCPNDLWNKYSAGWPILCPVCFAKLAEEQGFKCTAWMVLPENGKK